jgi:hypothetical protein
LLKDTLSRLESQLLCIFANSLEAVLNPKVDVKCSQTTGIYKPRAGVKLVSSGVETLSRLARAEPAIGVILPDLVQLAKRHGEMRREEARAPSYNHAVRHLRDSMAAVEALKWQLQTMLDVLAWLNGLTDRDRRLFVDALGILQDRLGSGGRARHLIRAFSAT